MRAMAVRMGAKNADLFLKGSLVCLSLGCKPVRPCGTSPTHTVRVDAIRARFRRATGFALQAKP